MLAILTVASVPAWIYTLRNRPLRFKIPHSLPASQIKAPPIALAVVVPKSEVAFPVMARSWDEKYFPEELWSRGDPDVRPASGGCVLSRTGGMEARDAKFRDHVLVATVLGSRPDVSPAVLLSALAKLGIQEKQVKVEVCAPPSDFTLKFFSSSDCDRVRHTRGSFKCVGAPMSFARWHRGVGGSDLELGFLSMLSFDRLPLDAWEPEALSRPVNSLGGDIVEILSPSDSCSIAVKAWLQDPNGVPKLYDVEIPEPFVRRSSVPSSESDECASPSPPSSPTSRRSIKHQVIIHVG